MKLDRISGSQAGTTAWEEYQKERSLIHEFLTSGSLDQNPQDNSSIQEFNNLPPLDLSETEKQLKPLL